VAVDTLAKRNSVLGINAIIPPIPDGTISAGDRETLLRNYSGILSGAAIVVEATSRYVQKLVQRIAQPLTQDFT
jgi:hypothetical protein